MSYPQIPESKFKNFLADVARAAFEHGEEVVTASKLTVETVTSSTTLASDQLIDAVASNSGPVNLVLPPCGENRGQMYIIVRSDFAESRVNINAQGDDQIAPGDTGTIVLNRQYDYTQIVSTGRVWLVIAGKTPDPVVV